MSRFLDGLTEPQREVASRADGHLVVLAGPGSGKTHTVTAKIGHLFATEAVPSPFRIAALTFTTAAAREMKSRLRGRGFAEWDRLFCGTYHAFGQYLLCHFGRHVGIDEAFEVDPSGAQAALESAAAQYPRFTPFDLCSNLESLKRRGVAPGELSPGPDDYDSDLAQAYECYDHELRSRGLLDFGDLILWSNRLLRQVPEVAERVRNAYRYIVADEFQDTDSQQLEIILALAHGQASTVVADDDQSIYGWRGAVRENVRMARESLDAEQVVLGTNFRSDEVIVEAALQVISADPDHQRKDLMAASEARGAICWSRFQTAEEEASVVATRVRTMLDDGLVASAADVAVIARTHKRVEEILEALDERSIPWFNRDRLKFDDSWDSQLALATLCCVTEPGSSAALRALLQAVEDAGIDRCLSEDALTLAKPVHDLMAERFDPSDLTSVEDLMQVLEAAETWPWLASVAASESDERQRKANVVALLEEAAEMQARGLGLHEVVRRFLGEGAVQIMTGHGSKGREFDVVFLVGLEDGTLPFYRALEDAEKLAEERRIFYVGLTRAKRLALLSRFQVKRTRYGPRRQEPSRFLRSIPREWFAPWPDCLDGLSQNVTES